MFWYVSTARNCDLDVVSISSLRAALLHNNRAVSRMFTYAQGGFTDSIYASVQRTFASSLINVADPWVVQDDSGTLYATQVGYEQAECGHG